MKISENIAKIMTHSSNYVSWITTGCLVLTYSTPLYTNIESQLISMLHEKKVFTKYGKIQLPLRNAFKWERIVKYAEDNKGYEVCRLN